MRWEDWHTHHNRCKHAEGSLKQYVEAAIKKNFTTIGLSDHLPIDITQHSSLKDFSNYFMPEKEVILYLQEAHTIKKHYNSQINVRIGVELDYIPEQENYLGSLISSHYEKLDYIIAGIHSMKLNGTHYSIFDQNENNPLYFLDKKKITLMYFKLWEKLLDSQIDFDIIAHFDIIRIISMDLLQKDKEILSKINSILDMIKEKNKVIEINTRNIYIRNIEQCPYDSILKMMQEKNISIILSSDAHIPYEIGSYFQIILEKLKKINYLQLTHFNQRKRKYFAI